MDDVRPRDYSRSGEAYVAGVRKERRRGRSRGYTPRHLPQHVQDQLKAWEETSLIGSLGDFLLYVASIAAIAAITIFAWRYTPWLGAALYIPAIMFIARQMRGLELMVHDASHWSWDSNNKSRNDFVADLCVAYPTFCTVNAYRKGHFIHHGTYAGDQDPCKRRFEAMGLGHVDLSTKWAITKAVIRWLPAYNLAYYTEIGSRSWATLGRWALWHLVLFILPLSLMFGTTQAAIYWSLFWLVPMMVTLPVQRSIAEAEEHDYERGETEFDSTITNVGWVHLLLWHPWNDGYHQVHHLFPSITARRHHKVHKLLMKHDEIYRAGPIRTKTLQPLGPPS